MTVVMQEELTLGQQAQTTHTQPLSQTYRVQLSPEILDPLCHGLGHAIYRLALALQPSMQPSLSSLPAVAASPRGVLEGPQLSSLQSTLGLIAGSVTFVAGYAFMWFLQQLQSLLVFAAACASFRLSSCLHLHWLSSLCV